MSRIKMPVPPKPVEKQFEILHMVKVPGERKAMKEVFKIWGSHAFFAEAGECSEESVFNVIGTDGSAVFTCPYSYVVYCREIGSDKNRTEPAPPPLTLKAVRPNDYE